MDGTSRDEILQELTSVQLINLQVKVNQVEKMNRIFFTDDVGLSS